jgi:LPXTG-site transpeptidase (sortase) family protein
MNDFLPTRGRIRSSQRLNIVSREVTYVRQLLPRVGARPVASTRRGVLINDMVGVVQHGSVIGNYENELECIARRFAIRDKLAHNLGKAAKRAEIVSRATLFQQNVMPAKRPLWARVWRPKLVSGLLASLAVIVLATTGYLSIDTWHTNSQAKIKIGQQASAVTKADSSPEAHQVAEGADKSPLPNNSLKNYVVAGSLPRALYITKSHVAARILPMNVNPNGSVQAPVNIFDSGWYTGSVKPGEVGAMFIDGHSSGSTHEGLFGNLDKLVIGDTLQVEKGDGSRLTYKVVHTAVVDKDNVDMKQMLLPYGNALRALNLMTCTGTWVDKSQTLTQRIEIFTEQVS